MPLCACVAACVAKSFRAERSAGGEVSRARGMAAFTGLCPSLCLDPPSLGSPADAAMWQRRCGERKGFCAKKDFSESFAGWRTSLGRREPESEEPHETPCRALQDQARDVRCKRAPHSRGVQG